MRCMFIKKAIIFNKNKQDKLWCGISRILAMHFLLYPSIFFLYNKGYIQRSIMHICFRILLQSVHGLCLDYWQVFTSIIVLFTNEPISLLKIMVHHSLRILLILTSYLLGKGINWENIVCFLFCDVPSS